MIQMRIYKLQDKGCILIKILQCMFYTSRIVKFSAFFYDLAAVTVTGVIKESSNMDNGACF